MCVMCVRIRVRCVSYVHVYGVQCVYMCMCVVCVPVCTYSVCPVWYTCGVWCEYTYVICMVRTFVCMRYVYGVCICV